MISKGKIKVIHVARRKVGMTDKEYRDLLGAHGAESCKDLDGKTFAKVMDRFEQLGFKSTSQNRRRVIDNLPAGKAELMKKLEAILLDMDLSWGYVDAIAKSRFKVEKAQWLEPEDLRKLVQMMIVHQKRKQGKAMYLRLSNHLVENWDSRVGEVPTEMEVNLLINQSKLIQHGRKITTPIVEFKTLSIYWHVERGLIITADPHKGKVVSVYTRDMESPFGVGSRLGVRRHG